MLYIVIYIYIICIYIYIYYPGHDASKDSDRFSWTFAVLASCAVSWPGHDCRSIPLWFRISFKLTTTELTCPQLLTYHHVKMKSLETQPKLVAVPRMFAHFHSLPHWFLLPILASLITVAMVLVFPVFFCAGAFAARVPCVSILKWMIWGYPYFRKPPHPNSWVLFHHG